MVHRAMASIAASATHATSSVRRIVHSMISDKRVGEEVGAGEDVGPGGSNVDDGELSRFSEKTRAKREDSASR